MGHRHVILASLRQLKELYSVYIYPSLPVFKMENQQLRVSSRHHAGVLIVQLATHYAAMARCLCGRATGAVLRGDKVAAKRLWCGELHKVANYF